MMFLECLSTLKLVFLCTFLEMLRIAKRFCYLFKKIIFTTMHFMCSLNYPIIFLPSKSKMTKIPFDFRFPISTKNCTEKAIQIMSGNVFIRFTALVLLKLISSPGVTSLDLVPFKPDLDHLESVCPGLDFILGLEITYFFV